MFKTFTIQLICVGIGMLCHASLWGQKSLSGQRPNFIIIVTDDQGYGDAGYGGNNAAITPNLDNLARTGLRLDRHYSAPVCSPTRASLLTGRYPTRMGVFYW